MSRSFTRAEIRRRALFLYDGTDNADFNPNNPSVNDLINAHVAAVYEEIVEATGGKRYASSATLTTTAGTSSYALESGAHWSAAPTDFWRLTALFAHDQGNQRRPVLPFEDFQRGYFQPPQGTYTLTLEYIPTAPTWSVSAADDGTMTFDGIVGHEELICLRVARDLRIREESDTTPIDQLIMLESQRIKRGARRTMGGPRYTRDVEDAESPAPWSAISGVHAYRLRGANIELFEFIPYGLV